MTIPILPIGPRFGTFFFPGPTEVRPEILETMQKKMIPHRGAEFEALFARIEAGLRDVFLTGRPVYVSTSSASGLMEGAILNAPVGAILALVNGSFSERFARIAMSCGREVEMLTVAPGRTFELADVEERLAARKYAAMTVVHSESSTGVLTDVREMTAAAHRHGAMCLVDSVTGVAGAPLQFDAWEMDFVLTGSQKALALPPGLAFAAASAAYVESAKTVPNRGSYFDIVEFDAFAHKNQTPNTPAVSLLYALDAQLADIGREGIERRWERHEAMRAATERWVYRCADRLGIPLMHVAPEGARSPTVTGIYLPKDVRSSDLVKAVAGRGYVIGAGYGPLKDTTFRIGHMGDHTLDGLHGCLEACEKSLRSLT
ncbi:MAG: aminotransferase class [Gemmatimonadetes bacterium]|nr:aminotransferase class [Gemmatimonadota bacterium]